jgi:hypothetical protein
MCYTQSLSALHGSKSAVRHDLTLSGSALSAMAKAV